MEKGLLRPFPPLEVAMLLAKSPVVHVLLEKTLTLGLDCHWMEYLVRRASCDATSKVHKSPRFCTELLYKHMTLSRTTKFGAGSVT